MDKYKKRVKFLITLIVVNVILGLIFYGISYTLEDVYSRNEYYLNRTVNEMYEKNELRLSNESLNRLNNLSLFDSDNNEVYFEWKIERYPYQQAPAATSRFINVYYDDEKFNLRLTGYSIHTWDDGNISNMYDARGSFVLNGVELSELDNRSFHASINPSVSNFYSYSKINQVVDDFNEENYVNLTIFGIYIFKGLYIFLIYVSSLSIIAVIIYSSKIKRYEVFNSDQEAETYYTELKKLRKKKRDSFKKEKRRIKYQKKISEIEELKQSFGSDKTETKQ